MQMTIQNFLIFIVNLTSETPPAMSSQMWTCCVRVILYELYLINATTY